MTASRPLHGFALLLTLALLSLVLLLLFGLVAVVRLETQAAANATELAQARANTRLAVRLALGQLQRYTGGTGVVTARADVAGGTWSSPAWTGVWNDSDAGGAVTWLVSGNENVPLALAPDMALTSADDIFLLQRNLAPSEHVKVRKVPIDAVRPGETGVRTLGRYAYWVGDESLKVSMNVRTDFAPPSGFATYPVPRTQAVVPTIVAASTNAARTKLLTVDQLLLAPFNVNGNTMNNTLWSVATAAAPRLHFAALGAPELIPGSFNANSRAQLAWSAYLDNLPLTVSSATAFAAIRDAERPFRSLSNFQHKLASNPACGATNAAMILSHLAPILGVRGDTFLVRAYGETLNPALAPSDANSVTAFAYCEALVQRTSAPAGAFGYRYVVVYFRWLGRDEI
ncbi:MAG: hypothetical protein C0518_03595 [Opitutus sp.]|nr:hypothetical protein [Opitutus sp.]